MEQILLLLDSNTTFTAADLKAISDKVNDNNSITLNGNGNTISGSTSDVNNIVQQLTFSDAQMDMQQP